jgi:Arc/MetJ family transcription regulator
MHAVQAGGARLWHDTKMRTNIDIEDQLMQQAMRSSGLRTKRAVVEEAAALVDSDARPSHHAPIERQGVVGRRSGVVSTRSSREE